VEKIASILVITSILLSVSCAPFNPPDECAYTVTSLATERRVLFDNVKKWEISY
jgi:hypothetical protein